MDAFSAFRAGSPVRGPWCPRAIRLLTAVVFVHLTVTSVTLAQTALPPSGAEGLLVPEGVLPLPSPERRPLPPPVYERRSPAQPLRLPPVRPLPEDQLPAGIRVYVRKIQLTGNTVFSEQDLAQITAPYENREITSEDLEALRHALTLAYVDAGYVNSGAVIPDQKVDDGVVRIHIVEGRLADIVVEGTTSLRPEYVSRRLALGAGPPLNVNELQERIQIMLQGGRVKRINADLKPGDQRGEARLAARVEERPPRIGAVVDNQIWPGVGSVRTRVHGQFPNPIGWGDVLSGELKVAEGLLDVNVDYALPVNAYDTLFNVSYQRQTAKVVESPFDELDIRSDTDSLGIRLSHPFVRTPRQQFTATIGLDRRKRKTFLFGERFSFPATAAENGKTDLSIIRFSQDWWNRSRSQVLAARSSFSFGIDALGATVNDSPRDGRFSSWLGQFQWARRLGRTGSQVLFRAVAQLTNNTSNSTVTGPNGPFSCRHFV